MEYPKEVQEHIDILTEYALDEKLTEFNIAHMYPGEIAYPDGYYDSRFFDLHLYNTKTKTKRIIKSRDGLDFALHMDLNIIRIFADGSTLIRFKSLHAFSIFQSMKIH